MVELRTVIIATVLMALILVAVGDKSKRVHARQFGNNEHSRPCTNNPDMYPYYPPCTTTSTESSTTTTIETVTTTESSTDANTSTSATSLQRAHWCHLTNGTYLPLDYTFIQNSCSICQCTTLRTVLCQVLQCLPTYCIDGSMPLRKSGQCCTQCLYESVINSSCVYKGLTFPHGAVIKAVDNVMECWCQLGNIECRNYVGSALDSMNLWGDNTTIYIIVIVIIVVLLMGSITCCACTVFTYYYYQRYQHTIQQAYDEYVNSAGWQPMGEDEQNVADLSAEEKRLEAEQYQLSNPTNDIVPPPYAAYPHSYVSGNGEKQN